MEVKDIAVYQRRYSAPSEDYIHVIKPGQLESGEVADALTKKSLTAMAKSLPDPKRQGRLFLRN